VATTAIVLPLVTAARSVALSHPQPAARKARLPDAALSSELRPPCQVSTVDLWFAETPTNSNKPKSCAAAVPSGSDVCPGRCTDANPGASGAVKSFTAAPSWLTNPPADGHA